MHMPDIFEIWLWLITGCLMVIAHFVGSTPFFLIFGKIFGRQKSKPYESNSVHASNPKSSNMKLVSLLAFVCDVGKGWLPVWLSGHLMQDPVALGLVGIAAFLGQLRPLFRRFQGGQVIATALGVFLALEPVMGLATTLVWFVTAILSRCSPAAAITSAAFAPLAYAAGGQFIWSAQWPTGACMTIVSLLVLNRYRSNLAHFIKKIKAK